MSHKFQPLAVVGVSALFPGSANAHGFWRDILAGRDLLTDVPSRRWLIEDHYDPDPRTPDKTYCKRGAFLDDVDFDPVEFGVPPSALSATDTCQLLALIVAKRVLEDALKGQFREVNRERASVILGVTSGQELFLEVASRLQTPVWVKALRESGIPEDKIADVRKRISGSYVPWQENTFPGLLGNVVAGRIANRFDLGGTNCVTDAACASSLSALTMAAGELQLGHSDLVITGGADTFNDISMFVCFSKTPALSPTGDCRPFSDRADGTILGEGLAMFALRRLADAERDGNRIYAVIRGIGSSSDGRSKSIYAPLPDGQAKAMRRAYEVAGYGPETVELVEAHGTGTAAGDAAEISSLRAVFGAADQSRTQWCALGSVKSQIGHTKAAAGAAGLFKVVMGLHHKVLPPTIKVDRPNPSLDLEHSPFYINTRARPWVRAAEHPRRASLSSFGFGGTNFHVTLEEYTGTESRPELRWNAPAELVLICAGTPAALAGRCRELARAAALQTLAETALSSQLAYDANAPERLAIVCEKTDELVRKLGSVAENPASAPGVYYGRGDERGRVAFLFPGQGSQYLGMSGDVALTFEEALGVWDQAAGLASAVFPPPVFGEPERSAQVERLTATGCAQPAIGASSASLLAVLDKLGVVPDCVGGHSFGEITALFAAGGVDFETMLRIAARRGELMASAATEPGGMLSVRMDAAALDERLAEWGLGVAVANHNGPRQTVVSGNAAGIDEAARRLAALGIEATRLPVSTAFHSPLVAGAVEPFGEFLGTCELRTCRVPFYSNLDGGAHREEPAAIRARLAGQIAAPVRFQRMVETMYADGVRTFIEVGPGSVLTSLVSAILDGRPYRAIALDRQRTHGVVSLWHGLGQMAALGFPLNWSSLRARHEVEKSEPKSGDRFVIPINGGNYGRPYPPPGGAAALPAPITAPPVAAAPVAAAHITAPPVAAAPVVPAPEARPAPAAASQDSVEAYRIFQESISEAHRNWQANLAKGHESFLRAMESAYHGSAGLPARSAQVVLQAPIAAPPVAIPVPPPVIAAPSPLAIPVPPPVAPARTDFRNLLWDIIAESTGYPTEMLQPEMALEADLGIDSIKRVEIFSTLQQRVPELPEFDQARIAEVRTLADIVQHMEAHGAPASVVSTPASQDLSGVVLRIISDKTGYPVEMLHREMSLEADLGIDSIKRVEIFSELQQQLPGLPEFDQSRIGELRTVADVVDHLEAGGPVVPAAPVSVEADAAKKSGSVDVSGPVLAIIAEKTGYPVEMLQLDMSLEADLGIDSIKRVEIFSAIQESVPELPALETSAMGALQTIADVIAFAGKPAVATVPAPAPLRRVVSAVDVPAAGHLTLDRSDGPVAIVGGGDFAAALASLLRTKGYEASAGDSVPSSARAAIFLNGLESFAPQTEGANANWEVFRQTQALAARFAASGGVFVTVRNAENAWTGGFSGLAKTVALEWPRARVKAIDLEVGVRTPDQVAVALLKELVAGGPEIEVLLTAGGARKCPVACTVPVAHGVKLEMGPDAVLVVSGGARGITAQCTIALARRTRCKVLLLGRTDAQAEEVRGTLRALREAGSQARYAQVDIRDRDALAAVVDETRREWGPITGVIHAAGVLADRRIENLTREQFASVFETKVYGLRSLLDVTSIDPLDVLCVFSSVAARYGNPGQSAYAVANEAMSRVAWAEAQRRSGRTKVKAIDWGPWEGGMVTPELRRRFEANGVGLLPMDAGAEAFADELLYGDAADVEVVVGCSPPARDRELRVRIDQHTHPFLADHKIQDVPVLPAVEALELFLRCALTQENAPARLVCQNLKVLRGVRLSKFYGEGNVLVIRPRGGGVFAIVGDDGARHYEATVLPESEAAPRMPGTELAALKAAPWTEDEIYGKLLFHGPAFQVIREVAGVSGAGISGTVTGSEERQWRDGYRRSDAAMLDGGLQLARLWGFHSIGKLTLPARIGSIVMMQPGTIEGPVQCRVSGRAVGSTKIVCDVEFTSASSALLATMNEVEMYAAPSE